MKPIFSLIAATVFFWVVAYTSIMVILWPAETFFKKYKDTVVTAQGSTVGYIVTPLGYMPSIVCFFNFLINITILVLILIYFALATKKKTKFRLAMFETAGIFCCLLAIIISIISLIVATSGIRSNNEIYLDPPKLSDLSFFKPIQEKMWPIDSCAHKKFNTESLKCTLFDPTSCKRSAITWCNRQLDKLTLTIILTAMSSLVYSVLLFALIYLVFDSGSISDSTQKLELKSNAIKPKFEEFTVPNENYIVDTPDVIQQNDFRHIELPTSCILVAEQFSYPPRHI